MQHKNSFLRLIDEILEDNTITRQEKKELDNWLFQLSPPPYPNDITALRNAFADKIIGPIKSGEQKLPADEALQIYNKVIKILWKHLDSASRRDERKKTTVHFDNLWQVVSSHLQKAQKKIDLAVYTISYNPMRDLLIELSKKGIEVRIVTEDSKINDLGSDVKELSQKDGFSIRIDTAATLMHHKFIVIDSSTAINGSLNYTNTGMNINMENIMVAEHPEIIALFQKEFDELWEALRPI